MNRCFTLKPVETLSYFNQLKKRTLESAGINKEYLICFITIRIAEIVAPIPLDKEPVRDTDEYFNARKRKREEKEVLSSFENKRNKIDVNLLESKIFQLYQTKSHWSLKEMNYYLQQPSDYIKETLSKICNYLSNGEFKGQYVLKPEYQLPTQTQQQQQPPPNYPM